MSYATLILGKSGSGKSRSLKNLDPAKCLLIQVISKPLPFRAAAWKGHIYRTADPAKIIHAIQTSRAEIIIIDDWNYIMTKQFFGRRNERGFEKFTDMGGSAFDVLNAATEIGSQPGCENKRVYILAHNYTDELGETYCMTLGKLLHEKATPEQMFTTVLYTHVMDGKYSFRTRTNGADSCKAPDDVFPEQFYPNDLALIDSLICEAEGIDQEPKEPEEGEQN